MPLACTGICSGGTTRWPPRNVCWSRPSTDAGRTGTSSEGINRVYSSGIRCPGLFTKPSRHLTVTTQFNDMIRQTYPYSSLTYKTAPLAQEPLLPGGRRGTLVDQLPKQIQLGGPVGRPVGAVQIVLPHRRLGVTRTMAPGQVRLRLAVDQAPVHTADLLRFQVRQDRFRY